MKSFLTIGLLVTLSTTAFSQIIVDGKDIADMDFKYVQIIAKAKAMSLKVTIIVDYGQPPKLFSNQKIEDINGKPIVFSSAVHALNFLYKKGWELCRYIQ